MLQPVSRSKARKGFTLVELAVVIVIIGVLAAFGVPKFLKSVEKSKASEAFNYLSAVQSAQERYLAQNGVYATSDHRQARHPLPAPQYFTVGPITAHPATHWAPTWSLTLTRNASVELRTYTVDLDPGWLRHDQLDHQGLPGQSARCTISTATTTTGS